MFGGEDQALGKPDRVLLLNFKVQVVANPLLATILNYAKEIQKCCYEITYT